MFKSKLRNGLRRLGEKGRAAFDEDFPKIDFQSKHIANCRSIIDREAMLEYMPENGIVAEIGVFKGDFSQLILNVTKPSKYYLIDIWGSDRYNDDHLNTVKSKFRKELDTGQVEIIRALSFEGIESLPDNHLDWVYLDTDHMLDTTRKELALLLPKMKAGGIIAGHDYIQGNWVGGIRYGVVEAVREVCVNKNWELIYITHELTNNPSFAIRKI